MPVLRRLIEDTLTGMEAGEFQDFCLHFLPLYDPRFIGLERIGHTADGKTRAGTPDLLKTDSSGNQTAVECGTEEGYWGPSTDLESLKPTRDVAKCLTKLTRPIEIVAAANRETPQSTPNIKSSIIAHFSSKTPARITLIDLAEIGDHLQRSVDDPSFAPLFKTYFPVVYEVIDGAQARQKYELAANVAREHLPIASRLFDLVQKALSEEHGAITPKDYILQQLSGLDSCRLRLSLEEFRGFTRQSVAALEIRQPYGRTWAVIGIPKIGKSHLLRQLARIWTAGGPVYLFDPPLVDSLRCATEVAATILRILLPDCDAMSLVRSKELRHASIQHMRDPKAPTVVLVDNANYFPPDGLKLLSRVIADAKTANVPNLACVFVSDRRLTDLASVETLVQAPAWPPDELKAWIDDTLGVNRPTDYYDALQSLSGGHPLLALALAKKHDDRSKLLMSSFTATPHLADEDLSEEVRHFLFAELLTDSDAKQFARRLAVLVGGHDRALLEALRRVPPSISSSLDDMLPGLEKTVVEGDDDRGYSVPQVFKQLLAGGLTVDEKRTVYSAVAGEYLRHTGNTLVGERIIAGIMHAFFAGEVTRASEWSALLISAASSKGSLEQLRAIVNRVEIVALARLPEPLDSRSWSARLILHLTLSTALIRMGAPERAIRLYDHEVPEWTEQDSASAIPAEHLQGLRLLYDMMLAGLLSYRDPQRASDTLERVAGAQVSTVHPDYLHAFLASLGHLPDSVAFGPRILSFLGSVLTFLRLDDPVQRIDALAAVSGVALRLKASGLDPQVLDGAVGTGPFSVLLKRFAQGVYREDIGEHDAALQLLLSAVEAASELGLAVGPVWSKLHVAIADQYYTREDRGAAHAAYLIGYEHAVEGSFEYAWAAWRLGLITRAPEYFSRAEVAFKALDRTRQWAKAVGARSAVLIKEGNLLEGARCLRTIVDAFYREHIDEVGPALVVARSHICRLKFQLEGINISDPLIPDFDSDLYARVVDSAKPVDRGAQGLYFYLAEVFRLLGQLDTASDLLDLSIAEPIDPTSIVVAPELVLRLMEREVSDRTMNAAGVGRCVRLLADASVQFGDRNLIGALSHALFSNVDAALDSEHGPDQMRVLLECAMPLEECPAPGGQHWRAEIALRQALLLEKQGEPTEFVVRKLQIALSNATEAKSVDVLINAGQRLGFRYVQHAGSFVELAQWQFAILQGLEFANATDKYSTFGADLLRFWATMDYRRLRESDLRVNEYMRLSAREIKGHDDGPLAVLMVVLLSACFGHQGSAIESLRGTLEELRSEIPATIARRLRLEGTSTND